MSRNGSGVYTLPSNSWNPAVANTQINATDWNATALDLSTAITQSIAYDGQTTCVGSIPFAQGIITSNTGLKVKDTGGTYTLAFTPGSTFSANRIITWKPNNANRTIDLAGNLTLAGSLTSSGAYPITLTATAATAVTLPTSGTLVAAGGSASFGALTASTVNIAGATLGSNKLAVAGNAAIQGSSFVVADASANPVEQDINNTGAGAAILALKGASAAKTLTFTTSSSGQSIAGTDTLTVSATGGITLSSATTLSAALTYGGVTLSNAVTGTGNMVLATAPSITGLFAVAGASAGSQVARFRANNVADTTTVTTWERSDGAVSASIVYNSSGSASMDIGTTTNHDFTLVRGGSTVVTLDGSNIKLASGQALQLGNAYVATPQVGTGYVTLKDSTGTTYKVLVAA